MRVSQDLNTSRPGLAGPRSLAHAIAQELSEKSAAHVRVLEISPISSIADYFVLANANSRLHLRGLVEGCSQLAPKGMAVRVEGRPDDGWVLVDFGDLIVHIFLAEQRAYFAIDELWSDARTLLHVQ